MITCVLSFIKWFISLIDFHMLRQSCVPRVFASVFTGILSFSFLVISLSGFGIRVILTLQNELESVLFYFLEVFVKD